MPTISNFNQDQYAAISGTRCVTVYIPDDDSYVPLLGGLLALAGSPDNYLDPESAQAQGVAQIWADAYRQSDWEGCVTPGEMFSSRLVLWGPEMSIVNGAGWFWNSLPTQQMNGVAYQATSALNDELQAHFAVPRGIYRLDFHGFKSVAYAQQQITWNGNAFPAVIDWYASSSLVNQLVQPGYNITLTDDSGLTINSKVTGRNASNTTGWNIGITWMKIRRTGDV